MFHSATPVHLSARIFRANIVMNLIMFNVWQIDWKHLTQSVEANVQELEILSLRWNNQVEQIYKYSKYLAYVDTMPLDEVMELLKPGGLKQSGEQVESKDPLKKVPLISMFEVHYTWFSYFQFQWSYNTIIQNKLYCRFEGDAGPSLRKERGNEKQYEYLVSLLVW